VEKVSIDVKDVIRVVSIIHDIDHGKYFTEVEFGTVEGRLERITLERGLTGPRHSKGSWTKAPRSRAAPRRSF
jgi:hypothetical protein